MSESPFAPWNEDVAEPELLKSHGDVHKTDSDHVGSSYKTHALKQPAISRACNRSRSPADDLSFK
jgi:hypothetical protein